MKLTKFDTKNLPKVKVSFCGGMAGSCFTYVAQDIKIEKEVVSFSGYMVNDTSSDHPNHHVFLDQKTKDVYFFHTSFWPQHRIDNLVNCLNRSDMDGAMREYQATDPKNVPSVLKLQKVVACNNWAVLNNS